MPTIKENKISPAFPSNDWRLLDDKKFSEGLTKREYFAVMILSGIVSRDPNMMPEDPEKIAVRYADSLLAELAVGR